MKKLLVPILALLLVGAGCSPWQTREEMIEQKKLCEQLGLSTHYEQNDFVSQRIICEETAQHAPEK